MHINDILRLPAAPEVWRQFEDSYIPEPMSGCWLWLGSMSNGYGTLKIRHRRYYAHRLSIVLHHGGIRDGLHALHKCDNPACVNPDHLFSGTQAANVADMDRKGRRRCRPTRGEAHPKHKLTAIDVEAIRASNDRAAALASRYGVSDTLIYGIRKGTHWPAN